MGFFDVLKGFLSSVAHPGASDHARARLRDAWGLDDESPAAARATSSIAPSADADLPSLYDVEQWRKKLRRIFEDLPASKSEWPAMMTEARAYNLDDAWIAERLAEEFTLLIRGVVADRVLSEADHERVETARKLIGITESQAEATVHAIVAEAEAFFGGSVVEEA
ncbi:MAG: hypothetical protein P4L85_19260 [Paludisphaera borealis]|uniref:hypothetical protein n=1 Tax=Paludisphaera borealis TaxID=1387353 RepID=UPI00283ECC35|nr:hypothetical protein [Paludisphaera borealis]MDR3621498.1 hypothetical protein [Paludisphaera borealis]